MPGPDGRIAMTADAIARSVVWGAGGGGTIGVSIAPIQGKFDIALGVARRERQSASQKAMRPPKVSISNAAGMTLEDAERVHERLGEIIETVREAKRGQ